MLLSRTQGARPVTLIAYALLRGAAPPSAKHEGRGGASNVPSLPVGRQEFGRHCRGVLLPTRAASKAHRTQPVDTPPTSPASSSRRRRVRSAQWLACPVARLPCRWCLVPASPHVLSPAEGAYPGYPGGSLLPS